MKMHPIYVRILWAVLLLVGLTLYFAVGERGVGARRIEGWKGATMGTTYEVKVSVPLGKPVNIPALRSAVEAELNAVNQAMSTYLPESEISRFNHSSSDEPFPVGILFREVLTRSFDLHARTGGAFDPTVGPLVDRWGFGSMPPPAHLPSDEEIDSLRGLVGLERMHLGPDGLAKSIPSMQINLSAIAKGFAVDRVSNLLVAEGFSDSYVEIGGEVRCRGVNANGVPWRIGVQVPEPDAGEESLRVIALDNRALATSGDYRNFNTLDGRRAHHILDPRSGRPVQHDLASVSVVAEDCMTADALATALFVMGAEEGMKWVLANPGIEALFIRRVHGGGLRVDFTPGMASLLLP